MSKEILEEASEYVPPRNETERRIAEIWEQTLNVGRVGIREAFPDLGGDSLHAIRVMNAIRIAWSIDLTIEQVMEHQTVESLAQAVDGLAADPGGAGGQVA